jgi:hypothetical protein
LKNSSGADIESMIKWLKKDSILEKESHINLVEKVRKFALLNYRRIDEEKKKILSLSDEEVVAALLNERNYIFKQKDLATLVDKSPSALNKIFVETKIIKPLTHQIIGIKSYTNCPKFQ